VICVVSSVVTSSKLVLIYCVNCCDHEPYCGDCKNVERLCCKTMCRVGNYWPNNIGKIGYSQSYSSWRAEEFDVWNPFLYHHIHNLQTFKKCSGFVAHCVCFTCLCSLYINPQ